MRVTNFLTSTILALLLAAPGALQLSAQAPRSRISQALDESRRTVLIGETHPLAQARFDRGAAPADLPMHRMVLVLRRSPDQQQALDRLLEESSRTPPRPITAAGSRRRSSVLDSAPTRGISRP
jgi:hypothetical protein